MRGHKKVEAFLEDIHEQVRYRPMWAAIDEELVAHIEDKTELYKEYGVEEEEAISRAVRDMGDGTAIGLQMNEAHHTRISWWLLGPGLAFLVLGILGDLRQSLVAGEPALWVLGSLWESSYYLAGAGVLVVVMLFGYPFIIRHVKKICAGYFVFSLTAIAWSLLSGTIHGLMKSWGIPMPYLLAAPLTIHFGLTLLAAPVMAVFAYRQRHKGAKGLLGTALFVLLILAAEDAVMRGSYLYMAVLALLLTFLTVLLYMNGNRYLDLPRGRAAVWILTLFAVLVGLVCLRESTWRSGTREDGKTSIGTTLELFLTPERQASSTWKNGYNGVLIQELLPRASALGEIRLSQQEMFDYATGAWYYGEDGNGVWSKDSSKSFEENLEYLLQFIDPEHVTLEEILPQSYQSNYRIAYWILKYGWGPGLLLLGAILVFGILLVRVSFGIRNRLGRLVAFAGSICLLIQYLFYILGNFGHQFAWFGNLPFLSEGRISVVVNAVLLGLVLSAHRYDLVMEERLER